MTLAIVTASTNLARSLPCLKTWGVGPVGTPLIVVLNGAQAESASVAQGSLDTTFVVSPEYLGVVPAFRLGVDFALKETDADIIACLHDDVDLLDADWQTKILRFFATHPACGLAGFGGAVGLGSDRIYQDPYDPMQLARIGFRSNLVDAEVHGLRSLLSERVACLDGFSQIGRRAFWHGQGRTEAIFPRPFHYLGDKGIVHHLYDSLLGALAARMEWETWYLPIRCRHLGGQTAVGDPGYQAWAQKQINGGDLGFWQAAHKIGYDLVRDQLPLRV